MYHHELVTLLGNSGTGGERLEAFKNNSKIIITKRDYAEAIEAKMNHEIQGDHFGDQGRIHLEGMTAQYHLPILNNGSDNELYNAIDNDPISLDLCKNKKNYYSFFSDDAEQGAAQLYENFYKQILYLE